MVDAPDLLLTPPEAAEVLRLAPQTLARLRSEGVGPPYVKLHGRVRYRRTALMAWISACERVPTVPLARDIALPAA